MELFIVIILRNANQFTYFLSKLFFINHDSIWMKGTPNCISHIVAVDCLPSFSETIAYDSSQTNIINYVSPCKRLAN